MSWCLNIFGEYYIRMPEIDENMKLYNILLHTIPELLLLTGGKDGLQNDMAKIFRSIEDPSYSHGLKRRVQILDSELDRQNKLLDELIKQLKKEKIETFTPVESIFFHPIIIQRQLLDSFIDKWVLLQITNECRKLTDRYVKIKGGEIKGGGIEKLLYLILGVIIYTFSVTSASEYSSNSRVSNGFGTDNSVLMDKDTEDSMRASDSLVSSGFGMDNSVLMDKDTEDSMRASNSLVSNGFGTDISVLMDKDSNYLQKFIDTKYSMRASLVEAMLFTKNEMVILMDGQSLGQKEVKQLLKKSLDEFITKYKKYKLEITAQCVSTTGSLDAPFPDIAGASLQQLIASDAINADLDALRESENPTTYSEAGAAMGQAITSGVVDLTSAFLEGLWTGTSGTTDVSTFVESHQKKLDAEVLNRHIEKTANELVSASKKRLSVVGASYLMKRLCDQFPIPEYKVIENEKGIVVQFTYGNKYTNTLVDSLLLFDMKLDILLKRHDISSQDRILIELNKEKTASLITLATFGPIMTPPPTLDEALYDAGEYFALAKQNNDVYILKVLELLESFGITKQQSDEYIKAQQAVNEISRKTTQVNVEEWWKRAEILGQNLDRAGSNLKTSARNVATGAVDVIIDPVSHVVYKSVFPFIVLSLMASGGIALYVLFRCAGPLSRAYVNRINGNNPAAPAAPGSGSAHLPPPPPGSGAAELPPIAPGGGAVSDGNLKLSNKSLRLFRGAREAPKNSAGEYVPHSAPADMSGPITRNFGDPQAGKYKKMINPRVFEGGKTNKNRSKKTYKKMKKQRKLTKMKKQRNRKTQKRSSI